MVTNISIVCPGCGDGLRVRIALGHEGVQKFYVVCPHCDSALRCRLTTDPDEGVLVGLEVDDRPATPIDWVESPVVNVFTDLPIDPAATSMAQPGGSPFLMHMQLLGDPFHTWLANRGAFEGLIQASWRDVTRWWAFYVRRDWPRFDHHAREYWDDDWPDRPTSLQRHDAIHRALEVIFSHVFAHHEYVDWKMALLAPRPGMDWAGAASFAKAWACSDVASKAQADLFRVLDQFVRQRWNLYPGLIVGLYDELGVDFGPSWRITRDDFHDLRDLFGATFERSHQYLPMLMSAENAFRRGNPGRYPDGEVRALSSLQKKRAVDREKILALFGGWGPEIVGVLDRDLRNAIAHSTAHHDLHSGRIVAPKVELSYPEFVAKVAKAAQVPLLLLQVIKYLMILTEESPAT